MLLYLYMISCSYYFISITRANILPSAVLGGAIVAAVEQDAEQEEAQQKMVHVKQIKELLQHLLSVLMNDTDLISFERLLQDVDEGRGKFHKRRKMLKYLYPLLVGVLIAKIVILPLILKLLTALSSTSFVMSKIALLTTGLFALKWLFSGSAGGGGYDSGQQRTKLEIIHLPAGKAYYHHGGAGGAGVGAAGGAGSWRDDLSWSDSNLIANSHKYIPLGGSTGLNIGGGAANRYPHHNYDSAVYDGKPFL